MEKIQRGTVSHAVLLYILQKESGKTEGRVQEAGATHKGLPSPMEERKGLLPSAAWFSAGERDVENRYSDEAR